MSLKHTARLTSALLVRKGEAQPAMLRAVPPHIYAPMIPEPTQDTASRAQSPAETALRATPAKGNSSGATAAGESSTVGQQPPGGRRIAMTVRLDRERYIRLKTVGIHGRRSCQQLLTDALDHYLASQFDDTEQSSGFGKAI